jgi:hypothetical protein
MVARLSAARLAVSCSLARGRHVVKRRQRRRPVSQRQAVIRSGPFPFDTGRRERLSTGESSQTTHHVGCEQRRLVRAPAVAGSAPTTSGSSSEQPAVVRTGQRSLHFKQIQTSTATASSRRKRGSNRIPIFIGFDQTRPGQPTAAAAAVARQKCSASC